MAIEIQVPKLGLTMEEAVLVEWKFRPGERVAKDQIVLVLETDKVTFEMPSPGNGLLHPLVAAGSRILVSQVVGYLAEDEVELERLKAMHPLPETPSGEDAPFREPMAAEGMADQAPLPGPRIKASPLARRMAKVHGLDLGRIQGSGPAGRIVKADIVRALEEGLPAVKEIEAAPEPGPLLTAGQVIPIAGVRRAIFRNMHESLATQAQLSLHTEASAEALIRLRDHLNARHGGRISYNAILVKVIAHALREHPLINVSVKDDAIHVWDQIHVGVAMDLGRGLIVPKVRNADVKWIREISADLHRLIEAARENRLSLNDLSMGTFTLTNLGAWDIDAFTPIVNHPESAILGVGRIVEKPVARDKAVIVERRMTLSLSFDHRVIDGAPGAAFLKTIKDMIEDPLLMIA